MDVLEFGCTPCPNDTFCFEYLFQGQMKPLFYDIETLNQKARSQAGLAVTKISAACLPYVLGRYRLLGCGGAFAFAGGPKLVSSRTMTLQEAYARTVAVPGLFTTALNAVELLFGTIGQKAVIPSSAIIPGLLDKRFEVGLVIHEPMAVSEMGLFEIVDIGFEYQKKMGLPLPLGVIVAREDLGAPAIRDIEGSIRSSVAWARKRGTVSDFVRTYAPHLADCVLQQHIDNYVSDETERLSPVGRKAIEAFVEVMGFGREQ